MLHIINQNNYLINEKPSTKPSTIDSLVRPTMDPGCARCPDHPITISTKIIAASQYEILNSSVIILIQVGID